MSDNCKTEMSEQEIKKVLGEEDTGCLCLSRADEPYGVMLSYAYLDGQIVFHSALKGQKLEFIRKNPRVCFVVSRHPTRLSRIIRRAAVNTAMSPWSAAEKRE